MSTSKKKRVDDFLVDMETMALYENAIPAIKNARRLLDAIPAADVQPVRHGRWITRKDVAPFRPDGEITSWTYRCAECGELERLKKNCCPNCGAKMEEGT